MNHTYPELKEMVEKFKKRGLNEISVAEANDIINRLVKYIEEPSSPLEDGALAAARGVVTAWQGATLAPAALEDFLNQHLHGLVMRCAIAERILYGKDFQ